MSGDGLGGHEGALWAGTGGGGSGPDEEEREAGGLRDNIIGFLVLLELYDQVIVDQVIR